MLEYKWKSICNDASKPRETLYEYAKVADIPLDLYPEPPTKDKLCDKLSQKAQQREQKYKEQFDRKVNKCTNSDGLEGDEITNLDPQNFAAFDQKDTTFCDSVTFYDKWFSNSRTNPFNNLAVDEDFVKKVHKRAEYNNFMLGWGDDSDLTSLLSQVYPVGTMDLAVFEELNFDEFRRFVIFHINEDLITRAEQKYILSLSTLNQRKVEFCKIILRKKHKTYDQDEFKTLVASLAETWRIIIGRILRTRENVPFPQSEVFLQLLDSATCTQFATFCDIIADFIVSTDNLETVFANEGTTLSDQKTALIDLLNSNPHDTFALENLARKVFSAPVRVDQWTLIQRNRSYFAFFDAMTSVANLDKIEQVNTALRGNGFVILSEPNEFVRYWYRLFTRPELAVKTADTIYPILEIFFDTENVFVPYMTTPEIQTFIGLLTANDMSTLAQEFGLATPELVNYLFEHFFSPETQVRIETFEKCIQVLPRDFIKRLFYKSIELD